MSSRVSAEYQWAQRWAAAGAALADVRARELRSMSEHDALQAVEDLLGAACPADLPRARRAWSGLVELQRLLRGHLLR